MKTFFRIANRHLYYLFIMLFMIAIIGLAGCATAKVTATKSNLQADVYITPDGQAQYSDKQTPCQLLPKLLKRSRVTTTTAIMIHDVESTNRSLMMSISSSLRKAGYRRVIFVTTKHAESVVGKEPF